MSEMNRKAELLYMKNIIDLEVAKIMIKKIIQREETSFVNESNTVRTRTANIINNIESKFNPGKKPEFSPPCDFSAFAVIIAGIGLCFLFDPFIDKGDMPVIGPNRVLSDIVIGGLLQCIGYALYLRYLALREKFELEEIKWKFFSTDDRIEKKNELIKRTKDEEYQQLKKLENNRNQQRSFYNNEISKINNILSTFYGMNLIPNFFRPGYEYERGYYRGIEAIYWIYDWMGSSRSSLNETLLHAHMEDGIQRILRRLDTIIDKIEDQIQEERIRNEKMSTVIAQNQGMIRSLQNAEANSAIAAEYSQLASNYSKANAYFSLATYLNTLK